MDDSKFHQLADQLMQDIEKVLDNFDGDADIDSEINGGILTLSFENKTKIIINKQAPLHQVWLATKAGGYHFEHRDGVWICNRSGQEFYALLNEAASTQAGEKVSFS
jgi:CyaY protein